MNIYLNIYLYKYVRCVVLVIIHFLILVTIRVSWLILVFI